MSQTKAHPDHGVDKQRAGSEHASETLAITEQSTPLTAASNSIPTPEQGGHAHSHAAHLEEAGGVHTKPSGNLRQGSEPGALRQPPSVPERVGKQHR